jgi:phage terminase large subunit-like protein
MNGLPQTLSDYNRLEEALRNEKNPNTVMHVTREMASKDLYFLLRYVLSTSKWLNPEDKSKSFWDHPWLLDRCREVQFDSEDVLDVWARYHGKSTIKTFGFSILSMIQNPNITIGVFSVTKQVADGFVAMVKFELESNTELKLLFPDIFWQKPETEARTWTEAKGFTIKRPLNLKDVTMRGFGLTDTSFTGHRISHAIYDDAVNEQSVTTSDMVEKVNNRWELSLNVGMPGAKRYYIGTFYAAGDSYHHMASRGLRLRLHPCYEIVEETSERDPNTGLPISLRHNYDKPVLFSAEHLLKEEKLMGPGTFGVQMLCDPNAGALASFKRDWIQWYTTDPQRIARSSTVYILVDPASEKKKHNSRTAIWVIALGQDGNYYVLDAVFDRLDLHERTQAIFDLVARWKPYEVRYEKYSMQADIEHIKYVMDQRGYHFQIAEVGGNLSKDDRISRLVPLFANRQIYFPHNIWYQNTDGEVIDLVDDFIHKEYLVFPNAIDKDALDALSRMAERDMPLIWPRSNKPDPRDADAWRKEFYKKEKHTNHSWLGA